MTFELRAARDRIAADIGEAESVGSSLATTKAADLRLILAVLADEPAVERCRLCGGDVTKNALASLCDGAPHGRGRLGT